MKLTSEAYEFTVAQGDDGWTITLVQTATGQKKIFKQAVGHHGSLTSHMNSLTDSQCEQWFNAANKPKKEKKK